MKRAAVLLLLIASSCAAPPIRVTPAFPPGQQRTYELDAHATTITRTSAGERTERTRLRGRSILDLLRPIERGTRARIHVLPSSLTRDGEPVEPPAEQVAEVVIRHDGNIDVLEVNGVPSSIVPVGAADLAGMLGPPLPSRILEPGERFRVGTAAGRVAALRVERGYPCAILRLGVRRQIARERNDEGREVQLRGTEIADVEMAFAIREGFPVRVDTIAEAPLSVITNGQQSGEILVRTVTRLRLIEPRAR